MSSIKGNVSSTQSLNGGSAINVAVTPEIEVGTVTTLDPNSSVVVELDESSTKMNPVFNFGIPKGEKGEKGDAGSVKFIIVTELPTENIDESAIYMIPAGATTEDNTYEEYIYVNGVWESLGAAQVKVDLTDYVKNTDYATSEKAGLVSAKPEYGLAMASNGHSLVPSVCDTQGAYNKQSAWSFISKGTLENVLGWRFVTLTQAEYDALTTKDEKTYYYIVEE